MNFPFGGVNLPPYDNAMTEWKQYVLSRETQLLMANSIIFPNLYLCNPFTIHEHGQISPQAAEVSRRSTQIPTRLQMKGEVIDGVWNLWQMPSMEMDSISHESKLNSNPPNPEAVNPRFEWEVTRSKESKEVEKEKVEGKRNNNHFNKSEQGIISTIKSESKVNKKHVVEGIKGTEKELKMLAGKRKRQDDEVFRVLNNSKEGHMKLKSEKQIFSIKKVVHKFTAEEDGRLKKLVEMFGESSWSKIAKEMSGLNRKQIRDRYVNYLKKERTIKEFTAEEDQIILRLVRERGRFWSKIAEELVGRTPIMVKNRFYASLISTLNTNFDSTPSPSAHKQIKKKIRSPKSSTKRES
jgi:hypothetical protein